ncbi:MAG: alanine--tRNA ligase [Methanomassiliicoccales archaeon]|nr:MAG: alanine--tRNA ligase [Methanomassiliicoccales archaeon]
MAESDFQLKFFLENGFHRRQCPKCQRYYWTLGDWTTCGEPPCEEYTFIGNSPVRKKLDLHETREAYLSFFEQNGHGRVKRYPIVARWRDDVFFTQASIYDFQPWVLNGVIDPPANPLTISQTCVRFNDIDNVGKTGRHFTFFEMLAHHAFNKPGKEIYFKDRTVELCHRFFTEKLGIEGTKLRYVEEWWEGGGNSGPCVEVILEGVEVATLVFMMYRETPEGRKMMDMTVVDTGYGLERICWVSQGKTSAYEAVFGPVVQYLKDLCGVSVDEKVLTEYSKIAGAMNMKTAADVRKLRELTAERIGISYEELMKIVAPLEDIYVICDHSRALMLLLNDGVVPSNVREGYFARMLVRRALRSLRNLGVDIRLSEVVDKQIDYFLGVVPELKDNREDILNLVNVEEQRYFETLSRGKQLVTKLTKDLKKGEKLSLDRLIDLYDSHGLNPEIVKEYAPDLVDVPDHFYMEVAKRHERPEVVAEDKEKFPDDLPETRMLYYEDPEISEFDAKVVAVVNGAVALDQTAFYPEGGGQEWDLGLLAGRKVTKVIKVKTCILHYLDGPLPKVGEIVHGRLDRERRVQLMRHHTAAHIINGCARRLFGNHVWQAGAHKAVDEARLDITHYENLSPQQRDRLERECNRVVLEDIKVNITFMQRDEAERIHGYRLYQGGAVPGKIIRVVDIEGFDAEACGGIHCPHTGYVGPIRIRRTKRIQDGIVRVEYTAGMAAVAEMQRDKSMLETLSEKLNVPLEDVGDATERLILENREQRKRLESFSQAFAEVKVRSLLGSARKMGDIRIVVHLSEEGENAEEMSRLLSTEPKVVSVIGIPGTSPKVLVSRSHDVDIDCKLLLKEVMSIIGGGGGGKKEFAQGGGGDPSKIPEAFSKVPEILATMCRP